MDKLHLDQHISRQFNEDLEEIKAEIMQMGGLVEEQVEKAVTALEQANSEMAETVLETEHEINQREIRLDEQCGKILVKRQPAASDLRMVMSVSKAVADIERVGDEAKKIAKMALKLCDEGVSPRGYVEIRHIANSVRQMMRDALDSFARFDVDLALKVAASDEVVDRDYKSATRELVTYMMEDPRSISRVMNIMWALRSLERIGDHACNIAEYVIYLVRGEDVRHIDVDEMVERLKD
jgi:phosphate transport system protein